MLELQIYIIKLITNAVTDKLQEIISFISTRISKAQYPNIKQVLAEVLHKVSETQAVLGFGASPGKLCEAAAAHEPQGHSKALSGSEGGSLWGLQDFPLWYFSPKNRAAKGYS